jgi:hypothetical protein
MAGGGGGGRGGRGGWKGHLAVVGEEAPADLLGVRRVGVQAAVLEDGRHLASLLVLQLAVLVRIERDLQPIGLLDALLGEPLARVVVAVDDVQELPARHNFGADGEAAPGDEAPVTVVDTLAAEKAALVQAAVVLAGFHQGDAVVDEEVCKDAFVDDDAVWPGQQGQVILVPTKKSKGDFIDCDKGWELLRSCKVGR